MSDAFDFVKVLELIDGANDKLRRKPSYKTAKFIIEKSKPEGIVCKTELDLPFM